MAMMQNEIIGIGEQNYYGIGFFVNRKDQLTIIHHGGGSCRLYC
ncbi:hypothetical protein N824_21175 [Pedobacter sp. V48]|nr:hypothetical protein N824_21175 [Pedobacter sp. V48]